MKLPQWIAAILLAFSLSTAVLAQNKIDINTATQTQLEMLNGIGPKTASAIIDYRQQHGAYKQVEDLINVKGIGEKKFMRIVDSVIASSPQKTQ